VVELHVTLDREPVDDDPAKTVADRDLMSRAVGRLPVDQRAVMVLHFYLDLPLTEAADVLGIPVGTAKSRLHRGLETLRVALGGEPGVRLVAQERPE
jgi:RNA polymerase sigma factor (sigma-70 family)